MSPSPDRDLLHLRTRDELASMALGEGAGGDLAAHAAGCAECRQELAELGRLVALARGGGPGDAAAPPPAVWDRIAAEVAADRVPAGAAARVSVPPVRHRSRLRAALVAAAAVVAVGAAGVGGWAVGRSSDAPTARQASEAALAAQPGIRDDVHGVARVHSATGGFQLDIRTFGLPAHRGYYEVWLYDPTVERMVAVGTLGTGGRGVFTVPAGLDLRAYRVVDVSAQRYDGDPTHGRSVLRGPLGT